MGGPAKVRLDQLELGLGWFSAPATGLTPEEQTRLLDCRQGRDLELALAIRSLRAATGITSGADAAAFLETREHRR